MDFFNELQALRNNLRNTEPTGLQGIDDHIVFLSQLHDFREQVAEIDKLKGERYIDFINNILSVGTAGIYDNEMRFLFELIQNVDDCDYSDDVLPTLTIQFDINHGEIILRYNEQGFTPFNVFSITEIAGMSKNVSSDKIEIGEKGIGFKSVFGIAEKVLIQSGFFSFELHKDNPTIPIPSYQNFTHVDGTKMVLFVEPYKCKIIYNSIASEYKNKDVLLQNNPILFLNKLSSVRFFIDEFRTLSFSISNKQKYTTFTCEKNVTVSVSVKDYKDGIETNEKYSLNGRRYSQPIVFEREMCQSRYGASTEFVKKTLLMQVIVPHEEEIDKSLHGRLYSYFPTQVETSVPMAVHAPFKLIDSREYVDDQKNNEWFVHCCQSLSEFLKKVYLDLAKNLHENILYVLPKSGAYFFTSNQHRLKSINLQRQEFSGICFCNLPVFWANGALRFRKEIYSFKEAERIIETESVHNLLQNNKYLFHTPAGLKAESYGISVEANVYKRLFENILRHDNNTEAVLSLLDIINADYYHIISLIDFNTINYNTLLHFAAHKQCLKAFCDTAILSIKKTGKPRFNVNSELDWHRLRYGNPNTWTTHHMLKNYLYSISMHAYAAPLGAGRFFPTEKGIILDKDNPSRAFANFCNAVDRENLFTARWCMSYASRKLESADDSLTVEEYMHLLIGVRESIKSSLGKSYQGYIRAIANAGTKPDRFLLELLQNADDLDYEVSSTPSFSVKIHGDTLVTYCNEKGFTKADARSITSIGESTKNKLIEGKEKLIGEKGIGFKSVFSVAKKVYI